MEFWDLFFVALMPVLETLLVTLLGSLIATERFNLLRGADARNYLNNVVYMVVNIILTFVVGSILGWMLNTVNGCCAVVCKERNSPFGDPSTCKTYGEAYASVSFGVSALFTWTYLYILMAATEDSRSTENMNIIDSTESIPFVGTSEIFPSDITKSFLASMSTDNLLIRHESPYNINGSKVSMLDYITWPIKKCMGYVNLEMVFTPITYAVIIGFSIGAISPIQKLMVGDSAPLRVIIISASLVGEATIVSMTLIVGANLLNGLKKSGICISLIIGIMAVRFIISPILGILIVKAAQHWGFVGSYSLYQFVLMLQYALPPATAVGTIAQLLGVAESECSYIMIWTYTAATFGLTLWCTFFMWMLE